VFGELVVFANQIFADFDGLVVFDDGFVFLEGRGAARDFRRHVVAGLFILVEGDHVGRIAFAPEDLSRPAAVVEAGHFLGLEEVVLGQRRIHEGHGAGEVVGIGRLGRVFLFLLVGWRLLAQRNSASLAGRRIADERYAAVVGEDQRAVVGERYTAVVGAL